MYLPCLRKVVEPLKKSPFSHSLTAPEQVCYIAASAGLAIFWVAPPEKTTILQAKAGEGGWNLDTHPPPAPRPDPLGMPAPCSSPPP